MHDEAAFLLLEATEPWDEPVPSEWVLYMGDDPKRGPVGWTIAFDEKRDGGAWEVDVTFETLPAAPPLSAAWFTDVVEVSARGDVGLMEGTWHTLSVVGVPDGRWLRVRLSRAQPNGDRPTLLVQSWPAEPTSAAVLRAVEQIPLNLSHQEVPETAAGLAGAARIARDITDAPGARALSGRLGTVRVERDLRGRPSAVSNWFESGLSQTLDPQGYAAVQGLYTDSHGEHWDTCLRRDDTNPDLICGPPGWAILSKPHDEHAPPRVSKLWWQWARPTAPHTEVGGLSETGTSVLQQNTLRTVYLTPKGKEITAVAVEHSEVPIEWVDDLRDWWTYQLAILPRA